MEEINLATCKNAIEWIFEANFAEERPDMLNMIICSPGGDLNAAFALVDTMRGSAIPIRTIGLGQIASAGLMIFIAGDAGNRILTPNTSILSHQYSWGSEGKHHELWAVTKEFNLVHERMLNHYRLATGLNDIIIKEKLLPPQDVYLSAEEAVQLKICNYISDLSQR